MSIEAAHRRVIAATEHARMLIFRDESASEVGDELDALTKMIDRDSLEDDFAAAVMLLALLPANELDELLATAQARAKRETS
ncbi:MAG TPA: hypothetical protein VM600_08050 [Actinomycetota bacterium]|nr:hypothetical protein [Actinomycetota bacterium]